MTDKPLSFSEHIEELRLRILKCFIVIISCACLTALFIDDILNIIVMPIEKLVFIAPHEAFIASVKLALFGGLFLSSPFVIYQIWAFVMIGLTTKERRRVLFFGPLSFALFIFGLAFGYYMIVPIGLKFLLGFATESIRPMITLSVYVTFVGTLTLAFGVVFQLPLAMLFLTRLNIIDPAFLSAKRKEMVVGVFIAAAILTPPDIISQILMAIPLIILYEIGIMFCALFYEEKDYSDAMQTDTGAELRRLD